jgi:hypothetical protein
MKVPLPKWSGSKELGGESGENAAQQHVVSQRVLGKLEFKKKGGPTTGVGPPSGSEEPRRFYALGAGRKQKKPVNHTGEFGFLLAQNVCWLD